MKFDILDKVVNFLTWFADFIAKPLGIATWSIIIILGAAYWGEIQREKGTINSKEQIVADGKRIKELEIKIDTLSNRLINRDCSDEVQKYINLIQALQQQTSDRKLETQQRLEMEKKKTEELQNLNKTLIIK